MKLSIRHHNHTPSPSMLALVARELEALEPLIRIDEARVRFERHPGESPGFKVFFHLVTPGPDVVVSASDHTMRAAAVKALGKIRDRLDHTRSKRASRGGGPHVTSAPRIVHGTRMNG